MLAKEELVNYDELWKAIAWVASYVGIVVLKVVFVIYLVRFLNWLF